MVLVVKVGYDFAQSYVIYGYLSLQAWEPERWHSFFDELVFKINLPSSAES